MKSYSIQATSYHIDSASILSILLTTENLEFLYFIIEKRKKEEPVQNHKPFKTNKNTVREDFIFLSLNAVQSQESVQSLLRLPQVPS